MRLERRAAKAASYRRGPRDPILGLGQQRPLEPTAVPPCREQHEERQAPVPRLPGGASGRDLPVLGVLPAAARWAVRVPDRTGARLPRWRPWLEGKGALRTPGDGPEARDDAG